MAQAVCSHSLASVSLVRSGLKTSRTNAAAKVTISRICVSASLKESEGNAKLDQQTAVASAAAASVFSLLASAPAATAAQMVAELADDQRPLAVLGFLIPALGWVIFQIAKPALNQLNRMTSAKVWVGALGLGAAGLLAAPDSEAAELVSQIAADNRGAVLFLPLVVAIGWVLFNITGPALRQLSQMTGTPVLPNFTVKKTAAKKGTTKTKGLVGALGLGAIALTPESADAAQEVASLAADSRPLLLLFILVPVLGWVLFNILRPALNQLNNMQQKK